MIYTCLGFFSGLKYIKMNHINDPNPRNEKLYVDNLENCLHISVLFPISLPYSIEIAFNGLGLNPRKISSNMQSLKKCSHDFRIKCVL